MSVPTKSNMSQLAPDTKQIEDNDILRALELSKQEAQQQAVSELEQKAQEEKDLQQALRLSVAEVQRDVSCVSSPTNGMINLDPDNNEIKNDNFESFVDFYSNISREDFQRCLDEWFYIQAEGGIDEIERGPLVTEGSSHNDFRRGVAKIDRGQQQRAQYGRLEINPLYRILDALNGTGTRNELSREAIKPITAFMDIGMGEL